VVLLLWLLLVRNPQGQWMLLLVRNNLVRTLLLGLVLVLLVEKKLVRYGLPLLGNHINSTIRALGGSPRSTTSQLSHSTLWQK
jgi:hypothetical protein